MYLVYLIALVSSILLAEISILFLLGFITFLPTSIPPQIKEDKNLKPFKMPSLHYLLPRHSDGSPAMSDFTKHEEHSSSSSSSMEGMDMTGSGSSHGSMGSMTFHASISDPLYATRWTPTTKGQYAGTIIFIIALAFFYRFLVAYRSVLEHRWDKAEQSRKVTVAGPSGSSQDSVLDNPKEQDVSKADGSVQGVWGAKPWRWSVDLPRSGLTVVSAGIGYLL